MVRIFSFDFFLIVISQFLFIIYFELIFFRFVIRFFPLFFAVFFPFCFCFTFFIQNKYLWSGIENYIGAKIPFDIKIIFEKCGYDSFISLLSLKENEIIEIENTVNQDKQFFLRDLKLYSDTTEFNFKPGHKSTILLLPQKIESYLKFKKEKKAKSEKKSLKIEMKLS